MLELTQDPSEKEGQMNEKPLGQRLTISLEADDDDGGGDDGDSICK